MANEFVAFLRGISNVPMQPLRDALVHAGLENVRSYGGTGNLLFTSEKVDRAELDQFVAEAVGVEAFVREKLELAAIVRDDPFAGRPGAAVFFAHHRIDPSAVSELQSGGFAGDPPVIVGAQLYFVHPLRRPSRRGIIDLERHLGVRGTMRASRVVARVNELM